MKSLLTSGGVTNDSIRDRLVAMLGKSIAESSALCIPTAMYAHPWVGPGEKAWQFIAGRSENPMVDLGWQSMGSASSWSHPPSRQPKPRRPKSVPTRSPPPG